MLPLRAAAALLACALALPAEARRSKKPRQGEAPACAATCPNPPLFKDAAAPTAADAEVLSLCPDRPGGKVETEAVRDFLRKHVGDPRLAQALREVAPWVRRDGEKADWLASIWTGPARRNAFTHVLCGDDWDKPEIGGLHLEARYRQLERAGKVCYGGPADGGPAHDGEACSGGQCLVRFQGTKGFSCAKKPVGGFAQGLDAIDLIALGARAYVACCMGGAPQEEGQARLREGGRYRAAGGRVFQIWCGARNGRPGIATFYPASGKASCGP